MSTLDEGGDFASAILETVDLPVLALDGNLRVNAVNDGFLRQFQLSHDAVAGRLVYELGDGQWDIPRLRSLLCGVLDHDGLIRNFRVEHKFDGLGHRIMLLSAKRIDRGEGRHAILLAIRDDTERERLLFELEGRVEFADKLIDSNREALLVLGWDLRVKSANQPFYDMFKVDRSETENRLVYDLGNGQWNIAELRELLEDILPRKQSFDDYEVRHTFRDIGTRVMLLNGRRLDHLNQIVLAIRDITHRARREEHVQGLMREINHRSRNLLSLVQSIAHQTAHSDRDEFLPRFEERLQSLAAAQDLLVRHTWEAVPLDELVRSQVGHFQDQLQRRISFAGPSLLLTSMATQAIGMALHELGTNAAKYGALSADVGHVDIAWSVEGMEGGERFVMSWTESGGPPVSQPSRRGFGSSVISSLVEASVGGSVALDFAPSGVSWRLVTDPGEVLQDGRAQARRAHAPGARSDPAAKRVLVVEDEALLAADLAAMLRQAGIEVIGPAGDEVRALALFEKEGCDAALLDVNLRNGTSEPVANRLKAEGIPFLVVTGYAHTQLPAVFHGAPLVSKPLRRSAVLTELQRVLQDVVDEKQ